MIYNTLFGILYTNIWYLVYKMVILVRYVLLVIWHTPSAYILTAHICFVTNPLRFSLPVLRDISLFRNFVCSRQNPTTEMCVSTLEAFTCFANQMKMMVNHKSKLVFLISHDFVFPSHPNNLSLLTF